MGSAFTEDREAMENILSIVGGKRIVFVDSYTTGKTVGPEIASKLEIEGYRSKSFLDNKFAISGDCDLIEELVRMAEKDGYVVGIAHPYLATLDAMRLCLPLYTKKVQYTDLQRRL